MLLGGLDRAVAMWARRALRERWRGLVALALLAGLTGGLAAAAVGGARRTATAYDRFREATGRSDVILFPSQEGLFTPDLSGVRALPEVEAAGAFHLAPIGIREFPELASMPGDEHLYRTIDRPLLIEGRLPDPSRPDEIVLNRRAAEHTGLGVGDTLTIESSDDLEDFFTRGELSGGPTVPVTIVGIGDSNMELVFIIDEPAFVVSPAFLRVYRSIPRFGNLIVRLRPGTDIERFRARAARALGLDDVALRDQAEDAKRITNGTDLEVAALLAFAAAAALAGLVIVAQAVTRGTYALASVIPTLRALGFTPRQLVVAMTWPSAAAALGAGLVAAGAAIVLSARFPIGLAGRLEPDPGVHLDAPVVAAGAAATTVAILSVALFAAVRALTQRERHARSHLVSRVLRFSSPLPAFIGSHLALERGSGERALPVRPALVGSIAGIVGIVGAFGLLTGMEHAMATPSLAGQVWDADISAAETSPGGSGDQDPLAGIVAAVRARDDVGVVARQHRLFLDVSGASMPVHALEPILGEPGYVILSGAAPDEPDEIALAPASARALGARIGGRLRFGGRDVEVVGIALLPQTPHTSFDQGGWVTLEAIQRAAPEGGAFGPTIVVRFRSGVAIEKAVEDLQSSLGPVGIEPSSLPQDVVFLGNVRPLPAALAVFLALLASGALAHVLASAARRRAHDLAILRALGLRPRQASACVRWQGVVVVAIALVLGIPLGVVVGRLSWRVVAEAVPLLVVSPLAVAAVLLVVPAALVASQAIAVLPARRVARTGPAVILRAE